MCNKTIAKSKVVYNRSAKVYQVITKHGEIKAKFPSGERGKRNAEREAVRIDDPAAYDQASFLRYQVFTIYAMTHSRIWKAARIVADAAVYKAHPLSPYNTCEAYHVHSQSEPIFYTVTRPDDFYTCTCPDFDEFHAPTVHGQKLCKHIFAVKIMKAIPRPIPEYAGSPADIWRHLEATGATYNVIGAFNRRPYLYAQPQQRPAVAGEIIKDREGFTWRIVTSGERLRTWKIGLPADMPEPTAAAAIEASRYAHLDPLEADRIQRKREAMSSHNHQLKELQRQQYEQNEVKRWEGQS